MAVLALGLGYFFWEPAIESVRLSLDDSALLNTLWGWLQGMGLANLKTVLAPLIVIFAVTPAIVVLSLLVVAVLMTPTLVSLVAERRFPLLERKKGGSLVVSLLWSLGSTLAGGDCAGGVHSTLAGAAAHFDPAAADLGLAHLPGDGVRRVRQTTRAPRNGAKSCASTAARCWALASSPVTSVRPPACCGRLARCSQPRFVILVPLAIWIYTLVFAFSSLWFSHYCLAALETLRAESALLAQAPLHPEPPTLTHDDTGHAPHALPPT